MALVSYDYSDSENEEEREENPISSVNNVKTDQEQENDIPGILSHLPKTKTVTAPNINTTDDKLEDFIPKYKPTVKEKPPAKKVQITIPSLSQFKDDEDDNEPDKKRNKTAPKGSSLLSILPPAKGTPLSTKSFVPKILKNKPPASDKSKTNALVPHAVRKKAELQKKAALNKIMKTTTAAGSDVESDEDFELPESFDDEMWEKVCGRPKRKEIIKTTPAEDSFASVIDIAPEPIKPYDGLDNAAFKELVGKSKRPVNIKLVDINEEEILQDKDVWLTKSLTDPDSVPKPVIEDPVDPTRRKKHHITYLAEQAKANEQELQSQWSAKYQADKKTAYFNFAGRTVIVNKLANALNLLTIVCIMQRYSVHCNM